MMQLDRTLSGTLLKRLGNALGVIARQVEQLAAGNPSVFGRCTRIGKRQSMVWLVLVAPLTESLPEGMVEVFSSHFFVSNVHAFRKLRRETRWGKQQENNLYSSETVGLPVVALSCDHAVPTGL